MLEIIRKNAGQNSATFTLSLEPLLIVPLKLAIFRQKSEGPSPPEIKVG